VAVTPTPTPTPTPQPASPPQQPHHAAMKAAARSAAKAADEAPKSLQGLQHDAGPFACSRVPVLGVHLGGCLTKANWRY